MRRPPFAALARSAAACLLIVVSPRGDEAHACGGFFARGRTVPALEVEQTLIVYDAASEVEHFVREVTFKKGNETFGFVVPTPSRPEVAKVDDSPFRRLGDRYPMFPFHGAGGLGSGRGAGAPGGIGKGGVEVLSREKLGSFTAFVLAASDASALKGWLTSNHFKTTAASEAWLTHYVQNHYYFVAFRFDPPAPGSRAASGTGISGAGGAENAAFDPKSVSAETMRISFPTPVPFYPYLEPDHDAPPGPRVLDVWLVSTAPFTPVSARAGEPVRWQRPFLEGASSRDPLTRLKDTLGPSLAPLLPAAVKAPGADGGEGGESTLSVQVFEDQKKSRKGYGDVVFVPNAPVTLDADALAKRRAFFSVLDPTPAGTK